MIDHQVEEDVMLLAELTDIGPVAKGRFDLKIGERCKAAVT